MKQVTVIVADDGNVRLHAEGMDGGLKEVAVVLAMANEMLVMKIREDESGAGKKLIQEVKAPFYVPAGKVIGKIR